MTVKTTTEEKTITVNQTIYVADDGKEFDSELDCEAYEENCRVTDLMSVYRTMVIIDDLPTPPLLLADLLYDDVDVHWVHIETEHQLDAFYEIFRPYGSTSPQIGDVYLVICKDFDDPSYWEFADLYRLEHVLDLFDKSVQQMRSYRKSLSI